MGIQEAVIRCLSKYGNFHGRAGCPECWWWMLFVLAGWVILRVPGDIIFGVDSGAGAVSAGLFCLAAFLPGLAVCARRLHDTDRSAWWLLLMLVPVYGWVKLIQFFMQPGTPGPNRYGDGLALF
jgi:uncharacterized membrane protein YhaH (DUF805 family)